MRDYITPNSSFIDTAGWDSDTQTLGIKFQNGATWNYAAVPESVWQGLKASSSAGTYFHQEIKPHYSGTRVE